MTATATLPRTQVLVRGSHAWRLTKYANDHFVARNNKGVTHTYNNEYAVNKFWDFLESVGFKLRQEGWTLKTLVCHTAVAEPDKTEVPETAYLRTPVYGVDVNNTDWRDNYNASK